jgi:riboflavin synthase
VFTGLVEAMAPLRERSALDGGLRLAVADPGWDEGLEPGASVAVDGCCLTVASRDPGSFVLELTRETLARTRFASLAEGELLNLERPVKWGGRLGGHWVQGHVDGVVSVTRLEPVGETRYLELGIPPDARRWVVPQGSIALNGVSLTVAEAEEGLIRIAVIPHTWAHTNLSRLEPESRVHVEYDVLAKYVASALLPYAARLLTP